MYITFLVILAIIFAAIPILDALPLKKNKEATNPKDTPVAITEKMRCKDYYKTIAIFWVLVTPILIMCLIGGISLADIGFRLIYFNHNIWFTAITLILAFVLFTYELIIPLISKKFRERIINDNQEEMDEFPRTKKEKMLYSLVALSSAVCEETVYRGFLLFILLAVFPGIPIFLIILIAFVTFGIGHLYQGLINAIKIGLFGALAMSLLIVTDSIILVILLHFGGELPSAFLLSEDINSRDT
ncbi:MAG: CPBP family intramembrane metalloprotease [Defluviitaleaceae bacterium]|nr:CPBP family intramembrane metalloprotease [Defluviitaleaceae bacterium]